MRKNRTINDIFIGREFLNIEGRGNKHPTLIQYYANLNVNKTRDDLIELIGLDLETDADTGELKLIGFFEGNNDTYEGSYRYYFDNLLKHMISNIKGAIKKGKNLAYWNAFDGIHILKLFILHEYSEARKFDAFERYGRVSGEFDNKKLEWEVRPVITVEMDQYLIGIKQVVRDSIQFFIQNKQSKAISTCWGYNIASLYKNSLENVADASKGGRFTWYSKLSKEAHIVDWIRFETDPEYRELVLKSNKLDSRSAMALGYEVLKDFKEAHGVYPVSLISSGSLARSAIVAQVDNDLKHLDLEKDELNAKRKELLSSIPIKNHLDNWLNKYDEKLVKDLYLRMVESYSAGYIDAISFGSAEKGWYCDLAQAYPSEIIKLPDLRESTLEHGEGCPPVIDNSFILCRGLINIPNIVDYHSVTIKHFVNKTTNIRPTGDFYATYYIEERDYLLSLGASFKEESWIAVVTKGKLSVLSKIALKLISLRDNLISLGKSSERIVKDTVNSIYGIEYEAVEIFEEIDGVPVRVGYRAGEFWNPLYAGRITARTRLKMSISAEKIAENGGTPIVIMTDSITFKGKKTDLPRDIVFPWGVTGIKTQKTVGYYEEPEEVRDIVCFGSGRYGFQKFDKKENKWKYVTKRRGLNVVDIDDPKGLIDDDEFTWSNVMKLAVDSQVTTINVKVRSLITVPTARKQSKKYDIYDLGRIVEQTREVVLVANTKRLLNQDIFDINKLASGLVKTKSIHLSHGMFVDSNYVDGTYPVLREKSKEFTMKTVKARNRITGAKRQKKFYKNNTEDIAKKKKGKYHLCKDAGFNRDEATKMMSWSFERIEMAIVKRRSEVNDN